MTQNRAFRRRRPRRLSPGRARARRRRVPARGGQLDHRRDADAFPCRPLRQRPGDLAAPRRARPDPPRRLPPRPRALRPPLHAWSGASSTASATCSRSPPTRWSSASSAWRKSVRRDLHKMHAFVRFRRIEVDGDERFVAWFEPDHFILEATAGFFVERFRALALVDPHPDRRDPLGPQGPPLRTARPSRGRAHLRSLRGRLAGLLREHLQPGAAKPRRHPRPHGEEVLEEPARDCRHPGAGPDRPVAR